MRQVDRLLQQADDAITTGSEALRASAREALQNARFKQRIRGYARDQVERAVHERLERLGRGT
jgi:hypothetical protein